MPQWTTDADGTARVIRSEYAVERPTLLDWVFTREGWRHIFEWIRRKMLGSRPAPHVLEIEIDQVRSAPPRERPVFQRRDRR